MDGIWKQIKTNTLIVNIILNDDDYIVLGDMNQDGVLNVLDIVQLVNIILGN